MKRLYGIVPLVSLLLAAPLSAADNKAAELMEVMGLESQMLGGFEAMLPMINQMAAQMKLEPAEVEELKNIYRDWFENDIDRKSLAQQFEQIYRETFTDAEMSEMIAFFQTPTGQKMLKANPQLMQRGATLGMQEAQRKQQALMTRLQAFQQRIREKRTTTEAAD